MKILIVDNNQSITEMLSMMLKMEGHEPVVSNSGRNGLSLIESSHFDAVILDILMPEFSGLDVVNALCTSGKINKNKIIVMTASLISEDAINNLKAKGVHAVLKKPVEADALLNTIKS